MNTHQSVRPSSPRVPPRIADALDVGAGARDAITGLITRRPLCGFLDSLLTERGAAPRSPVITLIDIQRLGRVNEHLGRDAGDDLLHSVAQTLQRFALSDAYVGYLGGGRFAVIDTAPPDSERAVIRAALGTDMTMDVCSLRYMFNCGWASYPEDGQDARTLLHNAEAALNHAKATGASNLRYQSNMTFSIAERIVLEHRLRGAVALNRLELYYQPQVNLSSGCVESLEALLRWRDPLLGQVSPERFVPLLESSGLICEVSEWAIRQVLEDRRGWRERGRVPVPVAVNVSPLQLHDERCRQQLVAAARSAAECDSGALHFEITESAVLRNFKDVRECLSLLRAAGARIALDDFGTGYSSLQALSKLPIDILKIDRSFVAGLPLDQTAITLIQSIIGLASGLGITAVAEGIENAEQLRLLKLLNCDLYQGYYFCRPVVAVEIDDFLERCS